MPQKAILVNFVKPIKQGIIPLSAQNSEKIRKFSVVVPHDSESGPETPTLAAPSGDRRTSGGEPALPVS